MGKAGIILGKLASGAAEVLVPAALAEQAARIQAERDARLQQYAKESQTAQNTFVSGQNEADRTHQSTMATEERTYQDTVRTNEREYNAEERKQRLEQLGLQIDNAKLQKRVGELTLADAENQGRLKEVFTSLGDEFTDEQKAAALESYLVLNPEAREKVIVKQLQDMFGPTDDFAVFEGTTRVDNQPGIIQGRRGGAGGSPAAAGGNAAPAVDPRPANVARMAGVTDPDAVKKIEGYIRQLDAGDITEEQFDERVDALAGSG